MPAVVPTYSPAPSMRWSKRTAVGHTLGWIFDVLIGFFVGGFLGGLLAEGVVNVLGLATVFDRVGFFVGAIEGIVWLRRFRARRTNPSGA